MCNRKVDPTANRENCAFYLTDGYCDYDNYLCKNKCNKFVKNNPDLPPYEKYRILTYRANSRLDQFFRWFTIIIAIVSLIISLMTLLNKINPHILLDCISGQCIIIPNNSSNVPFQTQLSGSPPFQTPTSQHTETPSVNSIMRSTKTGTTPNFNTQDPP